MPTHSFTPDHYYSAIGTHPPALLVPVPSTPAARRARGGDHVLRLARVAARECATSVATPLRLVRAVGDSAGLDATARAANLSGAMSARAAATVAQPAAPRAAFEAVVADAPAPMIEDTVEADVLDDALTDED